MSRRGKIAAGVAGCALCGATTAWAFGLSWDDAIGIGDGLLTGGSKTAAAQLTELIGIHGELDTMSDELIDIADKTGDTLALYYKAEDAYDKLQGYSLGAFWSDFRRDFYSQYPGFEYMENEKRRALWRESKTHKAGKAYEVIGNVFGAATDQLLEDDKEGKVDLTIPQVRKFEAAGLVSAANQAEAITETSDEAIAELIEKLNASDTTAEAQLLTARLLAVIATNSGHQVRLLSRLVRNEGVEMGATAGRQLKYLEAAAQRRRARDSSEIIIRSPGMLGAPSLDSDPNMLE